MEGKIKDANNIDNLMSADENQRFVFCEISGVLTYKIDGDTQVIKPAHYLISSIVNLKQIIKDTNSKLVLVWNDLYDGHYPYTLSDWTLPYSLVRVLGRDYDLKIDGIVKISEDDENRLRRENPLFLTKKWLGIEVEKVVYIYQYSFSSFNDGVATISCLSNKGLSRKMSKLIVSYFKNSEF